MEALKLLIVEDDPLFGEAVVDAIREAGYGVRLAVNGAEALEAATDESFDMVLQDIRLPDANGLHVLREILLLQPHCKALVITGHATVDSAIEAMKLGACDLLTKPFPLEFLLVKLEKALKIRAMEHELDGFRKTAAARVQIISRSPAMRNVMEMARAVANTDATVLIHGESGTGKELLADAIHRQSRRAGHACVKINCAAIPENLVESELFGVERGAFTGADRSRRGLLEMAAGGSLFLDEIGEMPLPVQGKLLRVLEEKVAFRVGGTSAYKADFRLIAATHRDLKAMIDQRIFREDLFFRLNVVPISIPPLRERREDIPLLVVHFLKQIAKEGGRRVTFAPETMHLLSNYDFPGNVRELRNIIEQFSILYPGEIIKPHHIPVSLKSDSQLGSIFERHTVGRPLKEAVSEFEHRYIEKVIRSTSGNRSRAAEVLGLSRKVLWEKLKRKSDD
ncbi:sigma-54-dependent transcriptional regulator [Geotalea toluenoxydans]|uniref:sigma-54-dependent transcriptional regulator n=1 Tax=Geotalea toluenoxydans TaxID=421624 RepID=UPI0006CFB249|nr:sigma-54 dependent transcriptional regulator [Geotalea toluenoxydans]